MRRGDRCETDDGPGRVLRIENATRWQPAWILVELDGGRRREYRGGAVWEPGKRPKGARC